MPYGAVAGSPDSAGYSQSISVDAKLNPDDEMDADGNFAAHEVNPDSPGPPVGRASLSSGGISGINQSPKRVVKRASNPASKMDDNFYGMR